MFPEYTSIVITNERTKKLKEKAAPSMLSERKKSALTARRANTAAAIAGATFFALFGILIWVSIVSPITSPFFLATLGTAAGIGLVSIILFVNAGRKNENAERLKDRYDNFESDIHERVVIQPNKAFKKMNKKERVFFLNLLTKDLIEMIENLPEDNDDELLVALETGLVTKGLFGINERARSLNKLVKQLRVYQSSPLLRSFKDRVNTLNINILQLEKRIKIQKEIEKANEF